MTDYNNVSQYHNNNNNTMNTRQQYRGRIANHSRGRIYWRSNRGSYWKQRQYNVDNNVQYDNNNDSRSSINTINNNTIADNNNNIAVQQSNQTIQPHKVHNNNNNHRRNNRRRFRQPQYRAEQQHVHNNNHPHRYINAHDNSNNVNKHNHSPAAAAHKKLHSFIQQQQQQKYINTKHIHNNYAVRPTHDSLDLIQEVNNLKQQIQQLTNELSVYKSSNALPTTIQPITITTTQQPPIHILQSSRSLSDPHMMQQRTLLCNNNTLITTDYNTLLPPPIVHKQPNNDYYEPINSDHSSNSDDDNDNDNNSYSDDGSNEYDDNNNNDDNNSYDDDHNSTHQQINNDAEDTIDIESVVEDDNNNHHNSEYDGSDGDDNDDSLASSVLSFSDSQIQKDGLSDSNSSNNVSQHSHSNDDEDNSNDGDDEENDNDNDSDNDQESILSHDDAQSHKSFTTTSPKTESQQRKYNTWFNHDNNNSNKNKQNVNYNNKHSIDNIVSKLQHTTFHYRHNDVGNDNNHDDYSEYDTQFNNVLNDDDNDTNNDNETDEHDTSAEILSAAKPTISMYSDKHFNNNTYEHKLSDDNMHNQYNIHQQHKTLYHSTINRVRQMLQNTNDDELTSQNDTTAEDDDNINVVVDNEMNDNDDDNNNLDGNSENDSSSDADQQPINSRQSSVYVHSQQSGSNSNDSSSSSVHSWRDTFPYEQNIFILSRLYDFINRVYSCKDAVTYRAISKTTGKMVCIKLSDDYHINNKYDPKEVRLLSRVQGHSRICVLESWHPIPSTQCYAIVMEWVNSQPVEQCLFGNLHKIRQYMYDLLCGLQYMHQRGVLYRDIKPSNILWDDNIYHATYIDFDVATFHDSNNLHRSIVGTDGYMSPEIVAIDQAKQNHDKLPIKGYGLQTDLYSAGVVFGSLLFEINEDEVADLNNHNAKGDAMVLRVLHSCDIEPIYHNAYNLLVRLLDPNYETRITVDQALQHEFFTVEGHDILR